MKVRRLLAGIPHRGLRRDETAFFRDVLAVSMGHDESVANMNGYWFVHLRGPDGNVYAMVPGSSALPR